MNIAVVVFPGTSGEQDVADAIQQAISQPVTFVRHTETDLAAYDLIVLPGGASYGDYLRKGAIASLTPVMEAVKRAVAEQKWVIGIGNGFQILLEAGLLPGAMLENDSLRFHCRSVQLKVTNDQLPFTSAYKQGEIIQMPIAHAAGNYVCDEATLARLKANNQIVFRYEGENPNGSLASIAGICNETGNVLGLMPRPERAIATWMGSTDGQKIWTSIWETWREKHGATVES